MPEKLGNGLGEKLQFGDNDRAGPARPPVRKTVPVPVPRLNTAWSRRLVRLAALVAPLVLGAALTSFRPSFPGADAALLMVVVVVAVAAAGDRLAGVLGALSAGVWFDFFLTRPYERFSISHRADIETTALLFVVGLAVTELTARGRQHRRAAAEQAEHVTELHAVARMIAEGADARLVVARVEKSLVGLLELRSCRFDPEPSPGGVGIISQGGDVELSGLRWNWLPGRAVVLPAQFQGRRYGNFVLVPTPGLATPRERRLVAVALADEAGAALAAADRPSN